MTGRELQFRILPTPEETSPIIWLELAMREILELIIKDRSPDLRVGITLRSEKFQNGSAGTRFQAIRDLNIEEIWGIFGRVCQSNAEFTIDDTLAVDVVYISLPRGSRDDSSSSENEDLYDDYSNKLHSKSILRIKNNDNLCLPRAIVCGEVYTRRIDSIEWKAEWSAISHHLRETQTNKAKQFCFEAGVTVPEAGCGPEEFVTIQKYLLNRNIFLIIYDAVTFGKGVEPIFNGSNTSIHENLNTDNFKTIYILYSKIKNRGHFDLILNLLGLHPRRIYCKACNVLYKSLLSHKCGNICQFCFIHSKSPCAGEESVECRDCKRSFSNQTCFNRHKIPGSVSNKMNKKSIKSICDVVKFCSTCARLITNVKGEHSCGIKFCNMCKKKHGYNSLCYIQPITEPATKKRKSYHPESLFIFYDFETRQDEIYDTSSCIHRVNLCVAQFCCEDCFTVSDSNVLCSYCGVREHVFEGKMALKEFLDLVLREKSLFKNIICLAHNAKAFDAQFILKYIVDHSDRYFKNKDFPSVIMNGRNIIKLQIGRTKFIDSINYMPMKLADLPTAFGLKEIKKGYFPHLFNSVENENYIGTIPDEKFFSPDTMSVNEHIDFTQWYNTFKANNSIYNLKNELIKYCKQDVDILRRACMNFRSIFLKYNVCPFTESVTIASACSVLFRKNFLKNETIGIIPTVGYAQTGENSQEAISWLLCIERDQGKTIIHAGRSREYVLTEGLRVDGFLPPSKENEKGTVFEYYGCYFHGCPMCFVSNRNARLKDRSTFNERYEATLIKAGKIKSYGYKLVEIWGCAFKLLLKKRSELNLYLENHPLSKGIKINPRDAFFGGRTGNIVTHYNVREGERIKYVDVCSLYPYICKRGKFPLGHPEIFIGEQCKDLCGEDFKDFGKNVEGLVKCAILPPRNLFHPVLPVKMHNRLLFPLCRTCCEILNQLPCTHNDQKQRIFIGTWVSEEIKKAIEKGYKIIQVFAIWQYKTLQYDDRNDGLFTEYVNTFLKMKQEASGYPSNIITAEEKLAYIKNYKEKEGINLDSKNIIYNPGLRSVAKLCLNSFWGKFGQRGNLLRTSIIHDYDSLVKLFGDPEIDICQILSANENILYVTSEYKTEVESGSPTSNVVVAAYTTAQARLLLYNYLEKLEKRVLYYDTDSIIFTSTVDDTYEPPVGPYLGDMTNELECYGLDSYIETFVSGGPKFYGYRVKSSDGGFHDVCKVKGIRLNYQNSKKINFNTIVDFIKNRQAPDNSIVLKYKSIARTKLHDVITREDTKTCSVVLKKRRFVSDTLSYPFGHI